VSDLNFTLDLSDVEDDDLVPVGTYNMMVEKIEDRESRSGGRYLNVMFSITGPSYVGRKIFSMFNYENSNPVAESIGKSELKKLGKAVGVKDLNSLRPSQLLEKECSAQVGKKSDDYGDKNILKGFKAPVKASPDAEVPF